MITDTSRIPTVAVLMSTYNGERFLREQVDSVLEQEGVDVTLIVRDDGSQDGTMKILEDYGNSLTVTKGENVGVGPSFMRLVAQAGTGYDYYAFCDQDDVWLPDKLSVAVEMIRAIEGPALYCSDQMLVDAEGNELGIRYGCNPDITWFQSLCQNNVVGCTTLWNRELQELLSSPQRRPSDRLLHNRIHDTWLGTVAPLIGTSIYDANPHIRYRQHGNNVIGIRKVSSLSSWVKKLRDPSLRNGRSLLAAEIVEKLGDVVIDADALAKLRAFANYKEDVQSRRTLLRSCPDIVRHSHEPIPSLKLKILLGLF